VPSRVFAMSFETIRAGSVFCISMPIVGSKLTQYISPLRMADKLFNLWFGDRPLPGQILSNFPVKKTVFLY
jgi:hypothetical protein